MQISEKPCSNTYLFLQEFSEPGIKHTTQKMMKCWDAYSRNFMIAILSCFNDAVSVIITFDYCDEIFYSNSYTLRNALLFVQVTQKRLNIHLV